MTRPETDAAAFSALLQQHGMIPVHAPMITINFQPQAIPDLSDTSHLVFTSSNGVRAFCRIIQERIWPVFAVGSTTADAAKAAGFDLAGIAQGSVESLSDVIIEETDPNARLTHIAGTHIAGDLSSALERGGRHYERAILYEAVASESLAEDIQGMLRGQKLFAATFFSARTAKIFLSLLQKYDLIDTLQHIRLVVISEAVAKVFPDNAAPQILIASSPDQHAMIDILNPART
ncbi:uroporphyrinogen-III synthase [Parvularcula sp. IMCC14364]|uniref:uroporphyrinogen-III synthase n=1 Tax=Parvularcula sp. IMCC14364 TaxID=3067902 RepID=UPI002740E7AB|nr:uroporphyrinogen-III synthase [Parvularcula sp. IMCC14364]